LLHLKIVGFITIHRQEEFKSTISWNKEGTITERIADIITNEIIDQSDYLLDIHGGELNEKILHYVSFEYDCINEALCNKTNF